MISTDLGVTTLYTTVFTAQEITILTSSAIIIYNITTSPHNNFQDIDVFGGKNTVLIVLLVCFLLLIFVLISIGIIYRRRKKKFRVMLVHWNCPVFIWKM